MVAVDVNVLTETCRDIGLELNVSKCELIGSRASDVSPLCSFMQMNIEVANLLGAPLLQGAAMDAKLKDLCDNLARASNRLSLISAHDALVILRNSLSAPKVICVLRSAPCAGHSALITHDDLYVMLCVRSSIHSLLMINGTKLLYP